MELGRWVNWGEVVLWGAIGFCYLWVAVGKRGRRRWELVGLGAVFLAFGVSDYVELGTGAWWRPWWLAVWKVGCGVVFAVALLVYRRRAGKG